MKEKAIITAAITGSIHTPAMSPYLPITLMQIVDEAVAAVTYPLPGKRHDDQE
jgi:3,5-dioxohexanoate:acetyl-CoA acetone transferase